MRSCAFSSIASSGLNGNAALTLLSDPQTFCTACIENGLFKGAKSAALHRRYFFKCACCSDHSHVIAQRASRLLHFANRLADREPPFRLTIKHMSGVVDVLIVSQEMLVSDVKMLVSGIHPALNCGLQRLSVLDDESDDGYRLLENQKSLAAYGICGNAIVALAMADKFEFKLNGMDTTGALQHGLVRSTCVHNDVLFLSEMRCVRKWSIPDARLIATFGSPGSGPGQFKCAAGICTSPDGELLFVRAGASKLRRCTCARIRRNLSELCPYFQLPSAENGSQRRPVRLLQRESGREKG